MYTEANWRTLYREIHIKEFSVPECRLFFQLFPTGMASWKNPLDIFVKLFENSIQNFFTSPWKMIKTFSVSADDVGKRGASSSCSSCNKRSWSCRVLPQSYYTPYTVSKMVACKYSSLSVLLTATGKDSHSHRTDACNLAPTIPYWSCRFVWNLVNEHQLVNVVINIFRYCFQMKDKRTQRSNINVMSLLKNNHQLWII